MSNNCEEPRRASSYALRGPMRKLNGWQRLLMVISVAWIAVVAARATADYDAVRTGEGDITRFVSLMNRTTGQSFGNLSRGEIREYAELLEKQSATQSSQPTDASQAAEFRAADVQPQIRVRPLLLSLFFPPVALWTLFGCIVWIRNGFRSAA